MPITPPSTAPSSSSNNNYCPLSTTVTNPILDQDTPSPTKQINQDNYASPLLQLNPPSSSSSFTKLTTNVNIDSISERTMSASTQAILTTSSDSTADKAYILPNRTIHIKTKITCTIGNQTT